MAGRCGATPGGAGTTLRVAHQSAPVLWRNGKKEKQQATKRESVTLSDPSHHRDAQGAQGVKRRDYAPSSARVRAVAALSRILSDCTYMWERTVMGISLRTAETVKATTPYYYIYRERVGRAETR